MTLDCVLVDELIRTVWRVNYGRYLCPSDLGSRSLAPATRGGVKSHRGAQAPAATKENRRTKIQTAAGCAIRMENTCHAGSVEILGAAKSLSPAPTRPVEQSRQPVRCSPRSSGGIFGVRGHRCRVRIHYR